MPETIEIHSDGSVTVADAARLIGVVYRTVLSWTQDQDDPLPTVYTSTGKGGKGGATRVRLSDLLEWKARRAVEKALGDIEDDDEDGDGDAPAGGKKRYNYESARAKRMTHQANTAEIIELRNTRAVLPVDLLLSIYERHMADKKDDVMNLPGRLAARVAPIEDTKKCYDIVREECVALLNRWKSGFILVQDADRKVAADQQEAGSAR